MNGCPLIDEPDSLLAGSAHDAEFGAAVFGPGAFAGAALGGHLSAETDGLDALAVGAGADEGFAHGLGATFAEAAIVFRGSAFVGEAGDDDGTALALQEIRDFVDLAMFAAADVVAVEAKID